MAAAKKLFVKTFGCQMNVYDLERMAEVLAGEGFAETAAMHEADVILLNTCHIREKAAEKVYSDLGRIRQVKAARGSEGKETLVAVAGCVAQAEGAEMVRRAPVVDVVVGPQSYHRLGDLIARARREARAIVDTGFPEEDKFGRMPERAMARAATAFLTVQEGCDKFCTFCVVPYTRGAEFSRPVADVEAEARRLADHGVREITLLGQNVNAYHGLGPDARPWTLARLIARLARIDGLERLRYTTSHPSDMSDDLIAAHGEQPKLMPYLHLPFQSGADRILAAMNRKHTVADYVDLARRVRAARPDLALIHRYHRRLPRGDGGRVPGHLGPRRPSRFRPGLRLQVQPPPRHAGRGHGRPGCRDDQSQPVASATSRAGKSTNGVQFDLRRQGHAGAVRAQGTPCRPAHRPLALPASRSRTSRFGPSGAHRGGCNRRCGTQ